MSRRLALLIGNVHYQDGRLHAPVSGKTFTALADALEAPTMGGFDEVFASVNKPAVEVQLAIAEFLELSQAADDVLLLYFTGHALVHQGRPYLACADTYSGGYLDGTTIQADYVRRRFSLHPSRHKLVVLDCSTSVLLKGDVLPEDADWLGQAFQAGGVQVAAAARPYTPDAPASSTLTPALVEALRAGQARLNVAGLAATAAWLNEVAAPPVAPAPAAEAEPVVGEESQAVELSESAAAGEGTAAEVETVEGAETAVVTIEEESQETLTEPALAAAETLVAVASTAVTDVPEDAAAEPVAAEDEVVEPAVLVRVEDAAELPAPRRFPRRAAVVVLVVLLLLLLVGGLYRSGRLPTTAVFSAPTPTTAAVAVLPTTAPTASPTPTSLAVATDTPAPAPTATPGLEATDTAVAAANPASPTPSATPAITPSPTSIGVSVIRQLVYMRSGPAINFRILEYLAQGTAVTVLGRTESGEWYNVELADGRTGWVFSEMVAPAEGDAPEIPVVGTIPAPADEFYNFVAQRTDEGVTISAGHVYVGLAGPDATFQVTLLPETTLVQPTYENGQALGLGDFVVNLARVAEGEYSSTAVQLCMVSPTGVAFYCQTFPLRREW